MSAELRALNAQAQVSVTKVNTVPLHLKVIGTTVYVYPSSNVEVKVTAGSLWWDGSETVSWPGAVLEFHNELSKPIGMDQVSSFEVLFAVSTQSIEYGDNSAGTPKFRIDSKAGVVFADMPCDAILVFPPKDVVYSRYQYSPPVFSVANKSTTYGIQLDGAVPETFTAIVYAIHKPMGWPQIKAQTMTEKIQMPPNLRTSEAYSLDMGAITTPTGEWVKPKDWDSASYDKAKAYLKTDGTYAEGPDKDEAWLQTSRPLVRGIYQSNGTIAHTSYGVPKLKGSEYLDVKDVPKTMVTATKPSIVLASDALTKKTEGALNKIQKDWGATASALSDVANPT